MKPIKDGVDVREILTIVICCIMYVYDDGNDIFEIPYNGTDVFVVPPIAVTDI